jgi:hypothetical protein
MNQEKLAKLFDASLAAFLAADFETILDGVSERNSCARLGVHMTALLPRFRLDSYLVDPEYNRNHGEIKTFLAGEGQVIQLTCDLILHSRGRDIARDNLIAVEMKKFDRPELEKAKDRERLVALTKPSYDGIYSKDGVTIPEHVCGYQLGVFMQIDRHRRQILLEFFQNGARIGQANRQF